MQGVGCRMQGSFSACVAALSVKALSTRSGTLRQSPTPPPTVPVVAGNRATPSTNPMTHKTPQPVGGVIRSATPTLRYQATPGIGRRPVQPPGPYNPSTCWARARSASACLAWHSTKWLALHRVHSTESGLVRIAKTETYRGTTPES